MKKDEDRGIIFADKRQGETMGELTKRIRSELELTEAEKVTFTGRLDPMASGLVIYLKGDKRFKREEFIDLPKTYSFDLILSAETDTGDILGLIKKVDDTKVKSSEKDIWIALEALTGKKKQAYPAYSSKHVKGRALFDYARKGEDVPVVEKDIEIFSLKLKRVTETNRECLLSEILRQIDHVKGDFRQSEIKAEWIRNQHLLPEKIIQISCEAHVSSGTYIRSLAGEIGRQLGTIATALNIHRVEIGPFTK